MHNTGTVCQRLAASFYKDYTYAKTNGLDFDFDAAFTKLRTKLDHLESQGRISKTERNKHLRDALRAIKKKHPGEWRVPLEPDVDWDDLGRITSSETTITLKNLYAGTSPTNAARRSIEVGDDAGHIFAKSLGGRGGAGSNNIFSQLRNINRGEYNRLEKEMLDAVLEGKQVSVRIEFDYPSGSSTRPDEYRFIYTIDGITKTREVLN